MTLPSASARRATGAPKARGGDVLHHLLHQLQHRVVVAVRLVGLEHGELGVVGGVRALVAEVAVELEDLLHATDEQPLEEQLGCDAQVELAGRRR